MKSYSNSAEDSFCEYAQRRGWKVTKQGWPDFLVMDKHGKPIGAVEVKRRQSHKDFIEGRPSIATTKRLVEQKRVRDFLSSYGIPVHVWLPGGDVPL
jgi:hypothetical protein